MNMPASLLECLTRESALVCDYSALLEHETQALVDRAAVQQLAELAPRKDALASQLAMLSKHRDALLHQLGLPGGHEGTAQAVAADAQLAQAWRTLLDHASDARDRNSRNSMLVELSLRYTQQSLDALRQLTGVVGAGTYDAHGRGRRGYGVKNIVAA